MTAPPADKWPTWAVDAANTGHHPTTDGVAERPTTAWTVETDATVRTQPVVVDGQVIFGDNDGVVQSVDTKTGTVEWQFQSPASTGNEPVIRDGVLYIGNYAIPEIIIDGETYGGRPPGTPALHAIDLETGRLLRETEVDGGVYTAVTYHDGGLLVGSRGGAITRLDPETLAVEWTVETNTDVVRTPAFVSGTIYVGTEDRGLYAIDATTGEKQWARDVRQDDASIRGPFRVPVDGTVVADGTLLVLSRGKLAAYDAARGTRQWVVDDTEIITPPSVAGSTAFVGTADGESTLRALSVADGSTRWEASVDGRFRLSPPVVAGGQVVFATRTDDRGWIHAVAETRGRTAWHLEVTKRILTPPTVVNGAVYVGTESAIHRLS